MLEVAFVVFYVLVPLAIAGAGWWVVRRDYEGRR
jgi:hypothetical protein